MSNPEFENFDKAVRKILSVTPEELKHKREEWKKDRGKRKPKTSASGHASSLKG